MQILYFPPVGTIEARLLERLLKGGRLRLKPFGNQSTSNALNALRKKFNWPIKWLSVPTGVYDNLGRQEIVVLCEIPNELVKLNSNSVDSFFKRMGKSRCESQGAATPQSSKDKIGKDYNLCGLNIAHQLPKTRIGLSL